MSKHTFNLRLTARYESPDNTLAALDVQVPGENGWEPLDLNTTSPGFLIYVYSMFTCQHLYLRTNSAECGLEFAGARGEILVEASENWLLEKVEVAFDVDLAKGEPGDADVDHIVSRMQQCPVSRNFPENVAVRTTVDFHHE